MAQPRAKEQSDARADAHGLPRFVVYVTIGGACRRAYTVRDLALGALQCAIRFAQRALRPSPRLRGGIAHGIRGLVQQLLRVRHDAFQVLSQAFSRSRAHVRHLLVFEGIRATLTIDVYAVHERKANADP